MSARRRKGQLLIAVIGDMLASRSLPSAQRRKVQIRFNAFLESLNRRYRAALVSQFAVTLGDEFQCILRDASAVPDLIWDIGEAEDLPEFRLGIGYGSIDTLIPPRAINLDGPALHQARAAIERAKAEKLLGGVFAGFGQPVDSIANGIARLLEFHLNTRSPQQRRVIGLLREGRSQTEIAQILGRRPQTVNDHKVAAGWDAFQAGEEAMRGTLALVGSGK